MSARPVPRLPDPAPTPRSARLVRRAHVEAMQAGCWRALSEAGSALRELAPPDVVDAAVETWPTEDARLSTVRREVGLVEDAVRGVRFVALL
jgi:hypothetical protein